jgi:hypothetical protein
VDYFDVGSELVPMLYGKPKHDDALLVAMLLQTSIPALRRGGMRDRHLNRSLLPPLPS